MIGQTNFGYHNSFRYTLTLKGTKLLFIENIDKKSGKRYNIVGCLKAIPATFLENCDTMQQRLFMINTKVRSYPIFGMITSKEKASKPHHSKPMPYSNVELKCNRFYTHKEIDKINFGFTPRIMEERWYIYRDGEWIYLHRSWTGFTMFKAHFTPTENGELLDKIIVSRDKSQYSSLDDESDKTLALRLIDGLAMRSVRRGRPPNPIKIIKEKWICQGCGQENMATKQEFRETEMTVWPPGIKCKKCGAERKI